MTGEKTPARVAIIGTGGIAHAHAEALGKIPHKAQLVAVVDVDAERARVFAERFDVEKTYTDAAALFAAESLDLVHICTPPQSHVPLALLAQQAGVPALVEKPIALSLSEMETLVQSEANTGVPILTVFQHRFGAAAVQLRRLADSGVLGRPQVATCETLWYRPAEYFEVPWRGRWEIEGGGPTMGHGIHQFDLLLSILGPWSRVSAFAARQSRPTNTEDVAVAVAEFASGTLATVVNSVVSPRETSRLRFDFEFATVEVEHLYGYTDSDWTFTPAPGHEHLAEHWVATGAEISSHLTQIEAIVDALAVGEKPEVSIQDSYRTLEFAAATYASAFKGVPIQAGDIRIGDSFYTSMSGEMVPWAPIKETLA